MEKSPFLCEKGLLAVISKSCKSQRTNPRDQVLFRDFNAKSERDVSLKREML